MGVVSGGGPVRVLWLAKGLGPGGMERLLVNHARVGDRERFEYHAAYLVPRPDSVVAELEGLGVQCLQLVSGAARPDRGAVGMSWVRALRHLVRDRRIDVLHNHSPLTAAMTRPVVRSMRGGPGLVYTEHNTWDSYGSWTRIANALTYPLDDARFAVSRDARDSVPERMRGDVEVLTHGVDLDAVRRHRAERASARAELGVDDGQLVVVTVAHLRAEKAYHVLLDAAADVVRQHPNVLFLALGHGPLERELKDRHRALGLGDRFRFLGFRSDVLRVLSAGDVFCLSSRHEGLPVAYMEASAIGLPTVATAVGGLVDHVGADSGVLVPPDDPPALAAALARVLADPQLRARLADGATLAAREFDASSAVARQEAVYAALATGHAVGDLTGSS
jgi:glycosyltransferase involved in cell wall biosynthesis